MACDWREFLELAKSLAGQTGASFSEEAAQRGAVSRAYYAAFCWARRYAEQSLGFRSTGRGQDHKRLREYLQRAGKGGLAARLNRLRGWRNACDYQDTVPGLQQTVRSSISQAEKAIQECV